MDTQAFCDMNCNTFKDLAKAANLSHDHFIRTTDTAHKDAVRYFWEMLQHRGYIYTKKHEGWYSVSDEAFYPKSQVQPSLDPATGRKLMVSVETGKEVEWSSETNYHFRLSAFKDRLLQFYEKNPNFVRPKHHMDALVKSVREGLQDLSISRPAERLTWGVRVPGDESQTIYVWLDALVNYLTKAGYPFTPGKESEMGWPADIHVVGKDIVRHTQSHSFHCVYWPAFLMALDLPLPRTVLVHGHWTMNQAKMSKSTGNVVNPFFAIDRFGLDSMRFFLMLQGPQDNDSDYDNSYVVRDYRTHLQRGLGNLTSRTLGVAKLQLRPCIEAAANGTLVKPQPSDLEIEACLRSRPKSVRKSMDANLDPKRALEKIAKLVQLVQYYFHISAPWDHDTTGDPSQGYRCIYNACEGLRIAGILLQPFMPQKSTELLDLLGVGASARGFSSASYGADFDYGHDVKRNKHLFRQLLMEK
ncbi:hypothetical protein UA08_00152 [Talaromyces atroroseus]|uniref:Probable methionine--tRNA ligase, mitochondrial n=1 Tax=Talaromyces atroroseus TaxID=1441469 RepID=A0A225AYH5_TALAT|nr:hypothetical protein UA08_00152 [Talaromyces atroroseus]OKL64693.1 hypothetical protein UA08_00152 [Talaromyces atroroseus]